MFVCVAKCFSHRLHTQHNVIMKTKRGSVTSTRIIPRTPSTSNSNSYFTCSVWFLFGICAMELCLLGVLLHLRQPAFHDLSYLRAKIEIVRAQSDIRTGIIKRLQLEHEGMLSSINRLYEDATPPPLPPPHHHHSSSSSFSSSTTATLTDTDTNTSLSSHSTPPEGATIFFMNDSPVWFQRRYSSMILNILANTPPSWLVQIFHYNSSQFRKGLALNHGLRRLLEQGEAKSRVRMVIIPQHVKKKNKNKHMLFLPWVWEHMPSEMVLLVGGNHVLCSNSQYTLHGFLHAPASSSSPSSSSSPDTGAVTAGADGASVSYDYLGAPWQNKKGRGGGGGVSLRNVTTMRAILSHTLARSGSDSEASSTGQLQPHLKWGEEDVFFVSHMLQANHKNRNKNAASAPLFKLATPEVMRQFSSSKGVATEASFSVSGPLPQISFERREYVLQNTCPELKLLLPSLHEPACFGHDLTTADVNKCRKSICCLNNTKKKSC